MQATVLSFSPAEMTGSVLLDDGRALAFDAAAFRSSGLRLLRPGQRVRCACGDAPDGQPPRILRLALATLPLAP